MSYNEIIDLIIGDFISKFGSKLVEGCSDKEIEAAKHSQGIINLPDDYIYYLRNYGKSKGGAFERLEMSYDRLLSYREFFDEVWQDFASECLTVVKYPSGGFIFSDHLGYSFSLITEKSSKYSIATYIIGDEIKIIESDSFTSWLSRLAKAELNY